MLKSAIILLPLALASNQPVINQNIISLIQTAKETAYASIPANSPARQQSRALDTGSYLNQVANYGCWCTKAYSGDGHRGKPIDELDTVCRSWVRARNCEKVAVCDGELDLAYNPTITIDFVKFSQLIIANPGVVPPEHEYLTVECENMTECTKNRCEYETYWALAMSRMLTDNLILGGAAVNAANENLDEDVCVKGSGGVAADSCCGESPLWELFSSGSQSCVAGVLA